MENSFDQEKPAISDSETAFRFNLKTKQTNLNNNGQLQTKDSGLEWDLRLKCFTL